MLLLETDQTECYAADGRVVGCGGSGQDGAVPKRFGHLGTARFQVRDRVVLDRFTGAVWYRDANPARFPLTWDEAFAFVADLRARRALGRSDWQLPSRNLLFSLVSHQHLNPALPAGHPFHNLFNGYYWTGERCHRLADQAWYVHMGGGRVHRGMRHGSYMVWPVCPDPEPSKDSLPMGKARFDAQDGCVRDIRTGLMWMETAELVGRRLTWPEALEVVAGCNRERAGGFDDWRLPNIRELESLVDLGSHAPAFYRGHPFGHRVQEGYWSATTSVYEPRYAWVLYSMDGAVGVGFKVRDDFFACLVRRA